MVPRRVLKYSSRRVNMFDMMEQHSEEAVIKVIGVGGGGGNAVKYMVDETI